jgi:hypothetical protein
VSETPPGDPGQANLLTRVRTWSAQAAPWISLGTGAAGAAWMERRPERAGLIVVAALGAWGALLGFVVISRFAEEKRHAALHAVRLGSLYTVQGAVQLCLFFTAPFFLRAFAFTLGHVAFLFAFAAAVAVSVWDPWFERALRSRLTGVLLLGFTAFTTLACLLPMLGLPNWLGLVIAGFAVLVGGPVLVFRQGILPARLGLAGFAVVVPLFLFFSPELVPPAPLRLADAAIGTRLNGRELADGARELPADVNQLVCWTAISAPRGLNDELLHVWRHDGVVTDEIALEIRGGRDEGFRTWSRKRALGADPSGRWTCTVVTGAGQRLGRAKTRVLEPEPDASGPRPDAAE